MNYKMDYVKAINDEFMKSSVIRFIENYNMWMQLKIVP